MSIVDSCRLSGSAMDFLKVACTSARTSGDLGPEKHAEYGKQKPEDQTLRDTAQRSHPFVPLPAAPLIQKSAGKCWGG